MDKELCGKPVIERLVALPRRSQPPIRRRGRSITCRSAQGRCWGKRTFFAIEPYEAAARARGDTVMVLETDRDNHFDMITPGKPNGEKVADWLAANLLAGSPAQKRR
jgi:hypothetical protein